MASSDLTFSTGLTAVVLQDFSQAATSLTPLVDTRDTLFNPVSLRMRGRFGIRRGGLNGNLFVNYTDNYNVDSTETSVPIDSWTTVDLNASYRFSSDRGALSGVTVRASVVNLFDSAPPQAPSTPSLGIFGYDPTNASPLNRFVSFEVAKSF